MLDDEIEGRVAFSDFGSEPKKFEMDNKEIELKQISIKAKDDLPVKTNTNLDKDGLPNLPTGDLYKDNEILLLRKIVK